MAVRPLARARSSAKTAAWYSRLRMAIVDQNVANARWNGRRAAHYGLMARPDLRMDDKERPVGADQ